MTMPNERARAFGAKWRRYLRFWGANVAEDVQDEIAFHLEALIREYIARGIPRDEARRLAVQRFGDPARIARTMQSLAHQREQRMARTEWIHAVDRDVRYALRQLAKRRGFTTVALVTLALGIGANTAIFSAVNAVLLHPVATHDIDRIMVVRTNLPTINLMDFEMGPGEALDLLARRDLFDASGAWTGGGAVLTDMGEPRRVAVTRTMGRFFDVFGVAPAVGRVYRPDESEPGRERVAVLSYALYRQLGAPPDIVGKPLVLDGNRLEIVGVTPPSFDYPRGSQVYVPQPVTPALARNREQLIWTTIGRIKTGLSRGQFDAGIMAEQLRWHRNAEWSYDEMKQFLTVVPLVTLIAGQLRPVLLVLLGAVGVVLLIACANIASLQLVYGAGRARELAVRSALGADRGVIMRQLLIENLVLSIGGGVLGLAVGAAVLHLLSAVGATALPALRGVRLDSLVLGFTAAATVLAALAFGLVPAARASRINLQESLNEGGRNASMGLGRSRVLQASVVVQVALAVLLVLGAGLMIRSLRQLVAVNPGFNPGHVATVRITASGPRYAKGVALAALYDELLDRLSASGVGPVGLVSELPFSGLNESNPFAIPGRITDPTAPVMHANLHIVSGGYFGAMGIPLLRGRIFDKTDAPPSHRSASAVVIDETLAKTYFPTEDPIGKQIMQWGADATIVGVVGAVSQSELGEPAKATIYYSYRQRPWYPNMYIVARTTLPLAAVLSTIRSVVTAVDPTVPVYDARMLDDRIGVSLAPRRLVTIVLTGLGVVSLGLAMFGLYGVISYGVSQRATEFGIRMALGAQAADVRNTVIRHGVVLSCIGVGVGLAAAAIATRALQTLLFGVASHDPLTFVTAPLGLTAVVIAASYVPARRATRVSPVEALRGS